MTVLDHVGIYVKNMERSLAFYGDIFGFSEHRRLNRGETKIVFIDIGKGLLELVQRPDAPGEPPKGRWSHLALQTEDFDGLLSKIVEMGLEHRTSTQGEGSRRAFFKDPDGHDLEIDEKPFDQ